MYRRFTCIILMVLCLILPIACEAGFQVELYDVDKKAVGDYLMSDMVLRGYNILSSQESQVAFRKDVTNIWAQVLLGSRFNGTPELRAYFNLVPMNGGVLVTADVRIVTNPNSGFEHYTVITNKEWQQYLDIMKQYFNGYIGYGFSYAPSKKDDCLQVVSVIPGGPIDRAGIRVGDLISTVHGAVVGDVSMKKINEILESGGMGTSIQLIVRNPLKDKAVIVAKEAFPPTYRKPVAKSVVKESTAVYGIQNGERDKDGNIPIISVTPGSSAEQMGIKPGDKIISIGGIPCSSYTPDTFAAAFAGPAGSKIRLTIAASPEQPERSVVLEKTAIIPRGNL